MNILGYIMLHLGSLSFLQVTKPPPRWAICFSSALSYPNHLKNEANLGHTAGYLYFPPEFYLGTTSCPGSEPYTDSLLRGWANPAVSQWWCYRTMENKILDHYQDCQILWIKKAHLLPDFNGQKRKNIGVRCSEEDSRRLHGRSHPQWQQLPHLA